MQLAGKYAICNHLAKLFATNSCPGPTNAYALSASHKKTALPQGRAVFRHRCDSVSTSCLLLVAVRIVAGRVFFLVFVTANQATTDNTGGTTDKGTLTTTNNGTGYSTSTATNGRTFGLVAPAFLRRLGLGTASQHEKSNEEQEI